MSILDVVANTFDPPPTHICRNCGNAVRPKESSKLNGCFFLVLLCFFIVPGILYAVWAGTQKVLTCPKCGTNGPFVPNSSPEAARLKAGATSTSATGSAREEKPCPWCAETILAAAKICKHCGRDVS